MSKHSIYLIFDNYLLETICFNVITIKHNGYCQSVKILWVMSFLLFDLNPRCFPPMLALKSYIIDFAY